MAEYTCNLTANTRIIQNTNRQINRKKRRRRRKKAKGRKKEKK